MGRAHDIVKWAQRKQAAEHDGRMTDLCKKKKKEDKILVYVNWETPENTCILVISGYL